MTKNWQTIRVFISSTFRDMHAERDYLVKRVFPALRERLEQYRIHLIDIDLRWGITEEQSDSDQALDLCLQQIDECRPFFIGLLGERYGFVPRRLPEEAISRYGWIQHYTGKSITELEMLYGVLQNPEMRPYSHFYFRDSAFIADVHEAKRGDMEAEDAESAEKLRRLKTAIREARLPVPPMENYPCEYAGLRINRRLVRSELSGEEIEALDDILEDGIVDPQEYNALGEPLRTVVNRLGTVHLKGLEAFGRQVSEHLWQGIKDRFELPDKPPTADRAKADPLAEEQGYHARFIEQRLRVHVTRKAIQDKLKMYAAGDATTPLLVTGPSGSGKSATLARFARDWEESHPGQVIPHFVGASPGSTNLNRMLSRFCGILRQRFGFEDDIPFETNELSNLFREFIDKVPEVQPVLIVIDALNQLDETDNAHALYWLPREMPGQVKIVTSCIVDAESQMEVLESFKHRPHERLFIDPLNDDERRQIIHDVPSLSAKALDEQQVELLLENPATRNPLFLLVALEELRGFGSYEQLEQRIAAFPRGGDTVTAIFGQVLHRMEEEFDTELVRRTLSLLGCSRSGLSQHELLELIEGIGRKADQSSSDLFPVLRQLRPYLQHRGELIDFHHQNLAKAVEGEAQYLAQEGAIRTFHQEIADYFHKVLNPDEATDWSGDCPHGLMELPYHLVSGADSSSHWQQVTDLLTDFGFLDAKLQVFGQQLLLEDYESVVGRPVFSGVESHRDGYEALKLIGGALRLSAHILSQDANQLASQLMGRLLACKLPLIQAMLAQIRQTEEKPWLCPICQSLTAPGGALVRILARHSGLVSVVVISPDGRQVISGSGDGTLRVWERKTGESLRSLEGHSDLVSAVVVTPDGRRLVSGSFDDTLRVWDLDSGELLRTLEGHSDGVRRIAVTPDGRRVISGSKDCTLRVWDLESGESLRTFEGHSDEVSVVVISPDGQRVISGSGDNTLRVWELDSGESLRTLEGHTGWVRAVVVSPDGQRVISGSDDGTLRVWELGSGESLRTLEGHSDEVSAVVISPDGQRVISGSDDGTLRVWELETGELLRTLEGHTGWVSAVVVNPDGQRVISGSDDGTLRVWDLETGESLRILDGHTGCVWAVVVSPDGQRVISGSDDGTLRVWELDSGESLRTLEGHTGWVKVVVISPDGRRVISGARDDTLRVWELESGGLLRTLEGHSDKVNVAVIRPDGRWVVSGSDDNTLCVWELETGELLRTLEGHTGWVSAVVVSPDGQRVVSGSYDSTMRVWDLESGESLLTLEGHTGWVSAVVVSPDGQRLISGSYDSTMRVWDLESGESLRTLEGHTGWVRMVVVSPDGQRLISGSDDSTLRVWDLESSESLRTLEGHTGWVSAVVVSPDGQRVISGSDDGTLRVWELETGELLRTLEGHLDGVRSVAVTSDGRQVISGSKDRTLRVWDLDNGATLAYCWFDAPISICAVGSNTRSIVAGDESGQMHFLRMENI